MDFMRGNSSDSRRMTYRGLELCAIGLLARGHAFFLIQPNLKVGKSQPSMMCTDAHKRKDNKLVTAKRIAMKYEKLIRANPCWRIDSLKSHIAEEMFADVSIL